MLKKFIGEKVFCGLDIGSYHIKASLVRATDTEQSELLGVYETRTSGFKDSSVSDLALLSECIHKTVEGLTKKTGVKLKNVYIGIGGDLIETRHNSAVIPLLDRGSKVIGNHDIKKINNHVRLLGAKVEEEILHDFPQFYCVDDVNTALNPIGLYGRKLEVNSLLIVANITRLKNIIKAVNQAGYDVTKLYFTSLSSSAVSLSEKVRQEGSVLIDLGSKVTDVLVFKNGFLRFIDKISLGGNDVTRAISTELNLPFDLSEDIKKSYASAQKSDLKENEEILVKRHSNYIPIKREEIYQAIDPTINSLIQSIIKSLEMSQLRDQINNGIVMIGGGSLLSGLIERIEEETNLPVRLGEVKIGSRRLHNSPIYSSAVGLAQVGLTQSMTRVFSPNGHKTAMSQLLSRVREFYQEYF